MHKANLSSIICRKSNYIGSMHHSNTVLTSFKLMQTNFNHNSLSYSFSTGKHRSYPRGSPNVYVYYVCNIITRVLCNIYSIAISHYFVSD